MSRDMRKSARGEPTADGSTPVTPEPTPAAGAFAPGSGGLADTGAPGVGMLAVAAVGTLVAGIALYLRRRRKLNAAPFTH